MSTDRADTSVPGSKNRILRRFALVIPTMQAGGAERVMSLLAQQFDVEGHTVAIFTLEPLGAVPFYNLPARVRHVPLGVVAAPGGLVHRLLAHMRRVTYLRRALRAFAPDLVISFCTEMNILCLVAALRQGWPIIVSERVDPLMHRPAWPWRVLRRMTYPWAACVVVQSEEMRAYFEQWAGLRLRVISNPVTGGPVQPARKRPRTVLAVGRLARQKGFDVLLPAFAGIAAEFPEWKLRIIGEGTERPALEKLADTLELRSRIELPGLCAEMSAEYAAADVFVLSSRYEGFPNVLLEAMASGLPVVAADCRGGISTIIHDGLNGLLFRRENVAALATALKRLMGDEVLRAQLGREATRVADTYSFRRVMARWDEAVAAAIELRSGRGQ